MFVGHIAVGLGAKRLAPQTSVMTLVAAAMLVDLVWPVLVLAGVESVRIAPGTTAFNPLDFVHYPWTHSLLMVALAALGMGLIYAWRTGHRRGAWILGALVLSHWVLDFISHRPDLPLAPGLASKVGLGLWDSRAGSLMVEAGLFLAGTGLYLSATRATRTRGHVALWTFLGFVLLSFVGSLGAPPPSVSILMVGALSAWLYLPWLAWVERNRTVV
jgi:membrane-bound metal-dependent hydrolase YbcI (DUF457 family)